MSTDPFDDRRKTLPGVPMSRLSMQGIQGVYAGQESMADKAYTCAVCGYTWPPPYINEWNILCPCPACACQQKMLKPYPPPKHQPFEYDPIITTKQGSGTSETFDFHLLPINGLKNASRRFSLGQKNYKEKAYSANTGRQSLQDKEWLVNRCNHAIAHLYNIINYINGADGGEPLEDAGAVAWCGLMLSDAFWEKTFSHANTTKPNQEGR